ncbi:MAG: imidazole glycerol-phosphate synthase subunit HisH [Candidatus Methanomethylophilaceae archaeon]|nr:imidazole glycerol-phosphate synthase subunit HisH [Candidatus Methanomethylophilaceae archaeon]
MGNLHSIRKALERCGATVEMVEDISLMVDAECMVFPGVGAFGRTMERLGPFRDEIVDSLKGGTPCLGICIGMQILFEGSDEGGPPGLGLIKGRVVPLQASCVPHMGWNEVEGNDNLLQGLNDRYFYFAHSYYASPEDRSLVVGSTYYEGMFPSLFRIANTYGCQFHPEKSSASGLRVLSNFVAFAEECL